MKIERVDSPAALCSPAALRVVPPQRLGHDRELQYKHGVSCGCDRIEHAVDPWSGVERAAGTP
jgi:hypothetical protein